MTTGKSREHAFGVRKILYYHLLRIIFVLQSHFSTLSIFFEVQTPFWCSQMVFARRDQTETTVANRDGGIRICYTIRFLLI